MSALAFSLICAYFRNQWIDRFIVITAVALMSINYLIYIVAGQYFLAYRIGAFPVWGYESIRYLILPVIIGVISGLGSSVRFYRTIMSMKFIRIMCVQPLQRGYQSLEFYLFMCCETL